MIHIIYHGYFSFAIHKVVQDLVSKGTDVFAKPHTDYVLLAEKEGVVARDMKGDPAPDAILFFDKDIRLARVLEKTCPLFNPAEGIALADDKIATYDALAPFLPMIDTIPAPFHYRPQAPKDEFLDYVEARFGYPMVIKAAKGSFGEQVYLAKNRDEAIRIAEKSGRRIISFSLLSPSPPAWTSGYSSSAMKSSAPSSAETSTTSAPISPRDPRPGPSASQMRKNPWPSPRTKRPASPSPASTSSTPDTAPFWWRSIPI